MKVQTKVFLSRDLSLALDEASRRTRRSKSEIVQVAVASYLSPDGDEAAEAAVVRRLDRIGRALDRLERDVTISNEAVALFVKAWLMATPTLSAGDQKAQNAKGQERYVGFLEALSRRLAAGRLLRVEVSEERPGDGEP
jgi:predicted transcriptional regulator